MKALQSSLSRRRFLRSACTAGAAAALLGLTGSLTPLRVLASTGLSGLHTEQQTRLLMGTMVTLTAATPDRNRAQEAFALAFAEIERQVAIFDRRNDSSALGLLNAQGGLTDAPIELLVVLDASQRLGLETGFAFNPAITPVVDLFAAAKTDAALPGYNDADLKQALALAQPGGLRLTGRSARLDRNGMRLTLDGIAKGYIADAASRVLAENGLPNHMVNAGGDIRASGHSASGKPWSIGIQHPGQAGALLAAVPLGNGALATSGSYENYYDRGKSRHHLISHLTGKSADITSITVRAATAMQADSLATALALMPPVQAIRFAEERAKAACLIVDSQGRRFSSANWA